ncbi:MAG: pilus assembly protein N-terminal domain-containing protein, partial [Candidatus Eremiobacteraeota bacterium]|nr:pilus assembly protein N-terminal domain-containing protein [Candidatus Eremiobacteraeota bacterium]
PTQAPIIVDPAVVGVTPGGSERLRVMQVLGTIVVTVANGAIAEATIDQDSRTLTIVGKALGSTIVTVRDDRGMTRDVPVRVAELAGAIADAASVRVTGRPASQTFLREQALSAALAAVRTKPGATIVATTDTIHVAAPLRVDDIATIDVPIIVSGNGYFTVQGTTHVRVENFAQPAIHPQSLLVSDFPETLKENGILFTADLSSRQSERFLYYHYNPGSQPDRRIVLKVQNPSSQPALVQFIAGVAGPETNEMQVGHLSTQRFLVRLAQNEGTVVSIPGNATVSLLAQGLPARSVVSGLMQLHEIEGSPLHLTLVAQDAGDPVDGPIPTSALLVGDRPHARGIYDIPEFFFTYRYDAQGPDL